VRFSRLVAAWLALMCAGAAAHAEKRVALVIGNERYANLPTNEQLQKAVSDARAVGSALRQIGFDVVAGENVGRQALIDRLDEASRRVSAGDTAFFFFSGHGVAVDGANYILPADVPIVGAGQITRLTGAAVREEDITSAFQRAGARVTVVVLDACRNNPFGTSGTKGVGGEKGLAPHEPPGGVFTFYAASRGEAALDRLYEGDRNPNSVFTRALLPALARPDLDLPALAVEVREEVSRLARTVDHAQRPAYYDETNGGRIFLGRLPGAAPSQTPPAPVPAAKPMAALPPPAPPVPVTPLVPLPGGVDPQNTLVIDSTQGRIVIKLRADLAPQHVARLKQLARDKFYDNVPFHRVIDGFMAQTGDGANGNGTGGSRYPNLQAEFSSVPFKRGIVGMARTNDPNSANSQFFIAYADAAFLNGKYTVIGEVVSGMDAVDRLKKGEPARDPDRMVTVRVAADAK
jgi:peptidylprolyl isomerase